MKKRYSFCLKFLLVFNLIIIIVGRQAAADLPYNSFAYDVSGKPFPLQAPYIPVEIIGNYLYSFDKDGEIISLPGISGPQSIYVDKDDNIYVCDTQNNRIIKINQAGFLLMEYKDESLTLNAPEGIFVTPDNEVYVADTGNERIVIFNDSGEVIKTYEKPEDIRLANFTFYPRKISVDTRGFLYILTRSGTEGVMVITPRGDFAGFFGSNTVELNWFQRIRRIIYSSEQIKKNPGVQTSIINDITIDENGFIYTVTRNLKSGQIKKFNSVGDDLFGGRNMIYINPNNKVATTLSTIATDFDGNIYSIDSSNGVIYQYDSTGEPLFSFGRTVEGSEIKIGVFGEATSLAVDSKGYIFVADRMYNGIHVLRPTEFTNNVHRANKLYADGRYLESEEHWKNVIRGNVNFYKANLGIGKAFYSNREYKSALEQFKIAQQRDFYSDSLWEIRLRIMQQYFAYIASGITAILLIVYLAIQIKSNYRRQKE